MNDCCNPETNLDFCSDCQCKDQNSPYFSESEITVSHTTTSPVDHLANCNGNTDWIGDGFCDYNLNIAACLYDGDDCCKSESLSGCQNEGKIYQS